jgi:type III secretion protein N (ATPase)
MSHLLQRLAAAEPIALHGRVTGVAGLAVRAALEGARVGDRAWIERDGEPLEAEVVGLASGEVVLLPLGEPRGVGLGSRIAARGKPAAIRVGPGLVGRVLDGLGRPLDGRPLPPGLSDWALDRPPPEPLARRRVERALATGVRAIDGLLTLGEGQRLGLFAGPGAGKSTLLGQVARQARADVVVVGLVGERGREVREFLEGCLGEEGRRRAVAVVATGDAPPLARLQAARAATAVAEWFADVEGRAVLLLLDSLTRVARAQREVGLAAGEPPARQGYPPSAFAVLPGLLERAGPRERGSVTALYAVLAVGGDAEDPVADEVRGLLDGHVVLDARLGGLGRWPAVDVLASLSRLMGAVAPPRQRADAARLRTLLDAWERVRDLVALGAHVRGADPLADAAVDRIDAIEAFLRQGADEDTPPGETAARLAELTA